MNNRSIIFFVLFGITSCNKSNSSMDHPVKHCKTRTEINEFIKNVDYDEISIISNCDTISKKEFRDSKEFRTYKYRQGKLYYFSELTGFGSINQLMFVLPDGSIDSIKSDFLHIEKLREKIKIERISRLEYDSIMIVPLTDQLPKKFMFKHDKYYLAASAGGTIVFTPVPTIHEYLVIPFTLLNPTHISSKVYMIKTDGPISESKFWSERW